MAGPILPAFIVGFYLLKTPANLALFALKKTADKLSYTGFSSPMRAVLPVMAILIYSTAFSVFGLATLHHCPLPKRLTVHPVSNRIPLSDDEKSKILPVFFWDYSTLVDPATLRNTEIVIPYEKGPPEKLLSRILFRDLKTHEPLLELDGRRPRTFDLNTVERVFSEMAAYETIPVTGDSAVLIYQLQKEAGIIDRHGNFISGHRPEMLNLVRFESGTRLIGIPWTELAMASDKDQSGHFFFLGNDGSIFQVRCFGTCRLRDLLVHVEFLSDPHASVASRAQFIRDRLKKILTEKPTENTNTDSQLSNKLDFENRLTLYLASLITLMPQETEAYFHLGQLTHNRDTLEAMIRYGEDLKMDPAELAELKSKL